MYRTAGECRLRPKRSKRSHQARIAKTDGVHLYVARHHYTADEKIGPGRAELLAGERFRRKGGLLREAYVLTATGTQRYIESHFARSISAIIFCTIEAESHFG
jgi:hypothetical protein